MRLEFTISKREGLLLMLTVTAAIVVFSVRFLILPALARGRELKNNVEETAARYSEQQKCIGDVPDTEKAIEQQRLLLDKYSAPYDTALESWELDARITGLLLKHGMSPESLTLTESKPGIAAPYFLSVPDEVLEPPIPSETEEGNGFLETRLPILLTNIELEAGGETTQWQSFLDDIVWHHPSLRVTHFTVSSIDNGEETDNEKSMVRFTCGLEFYGISDAPCEPDRETVSGSEKEAGT